MYSTTFDSTTFDETGRQLYLEISSFAFADSTLPFVWPALIVSVLSGVSSCSVNDHLSNTFVMCSSPRTILFVSITFLTIFILFVLNMDTLFSNALIVTTTTVSTTVCRTKVPEEPQAVTASVEMSNSLSDTSAKEHYFIVFVIPTHPRKVQQRNVIRKTWAKIDEWSLLAEEDEEKKRIKVLFVCGNVTAEDSTDEFKEEVSNNEDIFILKNITEGRVSLRYKNMWGFRYSHQHFDFEYLVKTDDDIIVNLPKLITDLSKYRRGYYYLGRCVNVVGSPPQRWNYCSGGGYVLSFDLVTEMLNLPERVHRPRMKPEDVFTGWLVWNVNNNTEHSVKPGSVKTLGLSRYVCGSFNKWFYHGYKRIDPEERLKVFRKYFMKNTPLNCSEV